jgi:hypothetical protein
MGRQLRQPASAAARSLQHICGPRGPSNTRTPRPSPTHTRHHARSLRRLRLLASTTPDHGARREDRLVRHTEDGEDGEDGAGRDVLPRSQDRASIDPLPPPRVSTRA